MHLGNVADLLADQGARDRGADGHQTQFDVGFIVTHDLVGHVDAAALVFQINRGPEDHAPFGVEGRRVDDLGRGQLAFDFENSPLDEALLVLRGLVFGVLGQVALSACLGDGLDHGMSLDRLQALKLFLEFFGAALGEGNGLHDEYPRQK